MKLRQGIVRLPEKTGQVEKIHLSSIQVFQAQSNGSATNAAGISESGCIANEADRQMVIRGHSFMPKVHATTHHKDMDAS